MENTPTVLTVGGSKTESLYLKLTLEQEGWHVVCASSSSEALNRLGRTRSDMLIFDDHLPGLRSDELRQQFRTRADTHHTPIIVLTSDDHPEMENIDWAGWGDALIPKSVDVAELRLRVRSILGRAKPSEVTTMGSMDECTRGARLLAVDDSATYRAFLTETLAEDGYVV